MIRVGEQTGSLPEMLNHVADFYDEDVNIQVDGLAQLGRAGHSAVRRGVYRHSIDFAVYADIQSGKSSQ